MKRSLLLGWLLLLSLPAIYGQLLFRGQLIDESDGKAVAEAKVYVRNFPDCQQSFRSDQNGRFSYTGPQGTYRIEIQKENYEKKPFSSAWTRQMGLKSSLA